MKRLKAFWYVYRRSLIDVDYYKDLLKVKADFSFKYFISLALVATLLTTVRFAVPAIPRVRNILNNLLDEFLATYPSRLEITVQDGMWQINQPEPFAIKAPEFFTAEEVDFPENLVVLDHQGTINDLEEMDTFMIVNDVNLIVLGNQNRIEVYPLETMPDGKVTKDDVTALVENVRSFSKYIPLLIISFVLVGTLFYFMAFRLAYLFLVALILMAMGNVLKMKKNFRTYYKIALHTITLPLSMEVAFILVGSEPAFPYWFLGFNAFYGIVVIYHLAKSGAASK